MLDASQLDHCQRPSQARSSITSKALYGASYRTLMGRFTYSNIYA